MNRWHVPERLVRAYKSQAAVVQCIAERNRGNGRHRGKRRMRVRKREGDEDAREDREKREAPLTKRFTHLFAATNNLFMESAPKPHSRKAERKSKRYRMEKM